MRFLAIDVAYDDEARTARAAGISWCGFSATEAEFEVVIPLFAVAPYEPGAFYRRELPCALAVLSAARQAGFAPDVLIVDGYASFAADRPALGSHLHAACGLPVIGVAKTRFATAWHLEVRRGHSARPLYVTAVEFPVESAAAGVAAMAGEHRLPTLLKRLDGLSKGLVSPKTS